jgi:cation diffusion facilitator family transporter
MDKKEKMETRSLYEGGQSSSEEAPPISTYSNQTVLMITCGSFLVFVIAEIIGAIAGNSWSLLGDAAAMSIDVISYFTNMVAERIKSKNDGNISPFTQIILEVVIPGFSVTALIGVTIYVTVGAVSDIVTRPSDDDVDIFLLWLFSSLNAVVDIISAYMFYAKGTEVFYEGIDSVSDSGLDMVGAESRSEPLSAPGVHGPSPGMMSHIPGEPVGDIKNLNMISAFTHVGGDTLRTISVFIAAAIATFTGVPGYLCDAWAAVVVSVTIVIMVVPLCIEINGAFWRIRSRADTVG